MPIVDYKEKADRYIKKLLKNEKISAKNKTLIKQFLDQYSVSPARVCIFCQHIDRFLEKTDDLKKDIHDRRKINRIFKQLREELTNPAHYYTIVAISHRLAKWLNDGDKPDGFKDLKNTNKKAFKRNLRPEDMITWEDGLMLANHTTSLQLKAVILTQLDGGFRPSEFIDLKYGDVTKDDMLLIAYVRAGKTGSRDVPMLQAVPYLNRWLEMHPDKKPDSPLWVMEEPKHSHKAKPGPMNNYDYYALKKRLKTIAKAADFHKPIDFYNLRHSACTIAKKENLNPEVAAKKFGHSVKYYTETYGRLSRQDDINRYKLHYGIQKEIDEKNTHPRVCPICSTTNEPGKDLCEKCHSPLSLAKAIEEKSAKNKELDDVKSQLEEMKRRMDKMSIIMDKQAEKKEKIRRQTKFGKN